MSGFSIRNPFFIIVVCLVVAIVGVVTLARMPVDLLPPINIPVVVVATFYSGMPPQQIETNITNPFERWFTLASGIDHIESRSLPGVIRDQRQGAVRHARGADGELREASGGHCPPGRAAL
jgi:multidrug efflux pump subunit AcrB